MYGGEGNRRINGQIIAGVFYVVGHSGYDLVSLTDEQITRYMLAFWDPEFYAPDETIDSWFEVMERSLDTDACSVF